MKINIENVGNVMPKDGVVQMRQGKCRMRQQPILTYSARLTEDQARWLTMRENIQAAQLPRYF